VVRHLPVETEPAEPAIGQIEMNLVAEPTFGPDAEAVADDQYPDHQIGVGQTDGPSSYRKAREASAPPTDRTNRSIEPQHVIGRDMLFETETVETALPASPSARPSSATLPLHRQSESSAPSPPASTIFSTESAETDRRVRNPSCCLAASNNRLLALSSPVDLE